MLQITLCLIMTTLGGCVTPLAIGPGLFGIGLFELTRETPHELVEYRRVEGVGLLVTDAATTFGYSDIQIVEAQPAAGEGYAARTPLVTLATGDTATRIASQNKPFAALDAAAATEREEEGKVADGTSETTTDDRRDRLAVDAVVPAVVAVGDDRLRQHQSLDGVLHQHCDRP
ncbi:MAG: hypothetical protein CMJ31_01380 [Phycisphaerae bacterium]|nr:hypothetical protein [Phycisphaerae bacterium]